MSRKWSRMVQKNSQSINAKRTKHGQKPLHLSESMEEYKGRSMFLPLLFTSIATMFVITYSNPAMEKDGFFWFTMVCYYLMAIYFFFLRRPVLKIGKSEIATRRLGRDKFVKASEIEYIYFDKSYVAIQIRGKRTQWVYSKLINRFNINAMKERLAAFAGQHSIKIVEK
jgi:hypothetical protein